MIKSVGDIKLSNEEKKVVKKEENIGAFTVKRYEQERVALQERKETIFLQVIAGFSIM